jgi:hypothetical protein
MLFYYLKLTVWLFGLNAIVYWRCGESADQSRVLNQGTQCGVVFAIDSEGGCRLTWWAHMNYALALESAQQPVEALAEFE